MSLVFGRFRLLLDPLLDMPCKRRTHSSTAGGWLAGWLGGGEVFVPPP